jgi:hypothetical protein
MKFIDFICGAWALGVLAYILFSKVETKDERKNSERNSSKDK